MKIDVTQVEDVKFRTRFSWWSMWIDITVINRLSSPFLLQMSISRTNKKRFNLIEMSDGDGSVCINDIGDLTRSHRDNSISSPCNDGGSKKENEIKYIPFT